MKALTLTLILLLPIILSAQTVWEKFPDNPVMVKGQSGSFDVRAVMGPSVIFDGNIYKMWYGGYNGADYRIGYATSPDAIVWTKADDVNPILDVGAADSWDDEGVAYPSVLFDGTTYKMWYQGDDGITTRIGYATSTDGITWIKHDGAVLDRGSGDSWDNQHVFLPNVVLSGGEYVMFFSGKDASNYNIGCARSVDGISWTKEDANPVLSSSQPWEDGAVQNGSVLFIDNMFMMWYNGGPWGAIRTGYVTSANGVDWEKFDGYVLDLGQTDDWDDERAQSCSVYFDGEKYQMWYDNYGTGSPGSIGYATSDTTTVGITKEIAIPEVFELSQNYPNPFNPSTTIKYSIPSVETHGHASVQLKVYDVLGREVATLVNEQQKAGYYEVQFTSNNVQLTSGVYFYQLKSRDFIETKKMLLLR